MNIVFKEALPVLEKLMIAGYEAYFVGGCVRDFLLDREINDVDIATSATPDEVKVVFGHTIDVGIEHGTVVVLLEDKSYEVTTFRIDGAYLDSRRPSCVAFVRSLEKDLARRDFTINALAMSIHGDIDDFFGGRRDIEERIIRAVGNPYERFDEDALRMLRAIRFQSQLGFNIEDATFDAIARLSHHITDISQERITVEMNKTMMGSQAVLGLNAMSMSGLTDYLPGIKGLSAEKLASLDALETLEEKWIALLLSLDDEEPAKTLREWKQSRVFIKKAIAIHRLFLDIVQHGWDKKILFDAGIDTVLSVCRLMGEKQEDVLRLFERFPIRSYQELAVSGQHLLSWSNDRRAGRWVKELLDQIVIAILAGELNNGEEEIHEWLIRKNRLEIKS